MTRNKVLFAKHLQYSFTLFTYSRVDTLHKQHSVNTIANSVIIHVGLSIRGCVKCICWSVFDGLLVAVPVGVPAVELSIANTSLHVEWTALPPEKARGRITRYQVLLRQALTADQPTMEEPVITTVADVLQHFIDGMIVDLIVSLSALFDVEKAAFIS